MELKNFFAQDTQGNILPGATCYLYQPGTANLVAGLQNKNGAPLANPFTASENGLIQFAAPNGRYDLRVASGALAYTLRIQCNDVSENVQADDLAAHTGAGMIGYGTGTVADALAALQNAARGVPIKTVTSTSYTLLLADAGKFIEFTSADPVTVTIPAQSSTTFAGAEEYNICQAGAGQVSIVTSVGVTLVQPATQNAATNEQNSVCTIKRRAADSWRVFGDLESAI